MDIFDRIGDTIKNFLDGESDRLFGSPRRSTDSDYHEAMDELDEFLSSGKERIDASRTAGFKAHRSDDQSRTEAPMSESLKKAFAELGLSPNATEAVCKDAYKKLLKTHHPDRHASHEGNMKKATAKTAKLNEAWGQIEAYYAKRKE